VPPRSLYDETEHGCAVVRRIDDEVNPVGINSARVASSELSGDQRRLLVEREYADVQRILSIESAIFRWIGSGFVWFWITLNESSDRLCGLPGRLVESAIQIDVAGFSRGDCNFSARCVGCGRTGGLRSQRSGNQAQK